MVRPDRTHRVALYRRGRANLLQSTRTRPTPGTLKWIAARRTETPATEAPAANRPEFYTREAAARRLGVGKTTVWELTTRGVIGVAYIGRKPLIPAVELDRYIATLIEQARERIIESASARKSRG